MKYELNAKEARVIGCLLEKQVTTRTNTRFRLTPLPGVQPKPTASRSWI